MVRTFYRLLLVHSGDLNSGVWGPYVDRSDNDWSIAQDFISNPQPSNTQPRGIFVQGNGFAESESGSDPSSGGHDTFILNVFNTDIRNGNYVTYSTNHTPYVDLTPLAPISTTQVYGVSNSCLSTDDVLTETQPGARVTSRYPNVGGNGPYAAGIRDSTATKITVLDAFDPGTLGIAGAQNGPGSVGRMDYMLRALANCFGGLCPTWTPQPVAVGDSPIAGSGAKYVNFMGLRSANPMRSGQAIIEFGLAKTEPVEVKIYDVSGRLMRTLVNHRVYPAGQSYRLVWDGTNDAGQSVARGVYFYQLRTPTFASQRKLAVLKD